MKTTFSSLSLLLHPKKQLMNSKTFNPLHASSPKLHTLSTSDVVSAHHISPTLRFMNATSFKNQFKRKATPTLSEASEGSKKQPSKLMKELVLALLISLWFLFSVCFNIYIMQVLKVYKFPITISAAQFGLGTVLVTFMWIFNLYKRPKVSASQLAAVVPLAVMHTISTLFTTITLGKVAVPFTHTIKAIEPFFTVILSAIFLGEMPTKWVVASLVPIVSGVLYASTMEVSFNWFGFWTAMGSNLANQTRNVLSKKMMVTKEESMDNFTLFSIITMMSFVLSVPLALYIEGINFSPAYLKSAGLNIQEVYIKSILAALCFHAYQQISYMILERVSPITHAVTNCVKRVVVIASAVLFFRMPVSPFDILGKFHRALSDVYTFKGIGITIIGLFLYLGAKNLKPKKKTG